MSTVRRVLVHPEKGALVGALFLLACSTAWLAWATTEPLSGLAEMRGELRNGAMDSAVSAELMSAVSDPSVEERAWEVPQPQPDGLEWLYDLFTPPTIYRQAGSDAFLASLPAVTMPAQSSRHSTFDLLEVRPALFRLQLVGFAGEAGNCLGLFENTLTTEHFLAGSDELISGLGLRIEHFRVVRPQDRNADERGATTGWIAEALVRDEASGEEIMLTDRERTYHGEPSAVLGHHGASDERFTLQRGEEIECDGICYRVQAVQLAPPTVELTAVSAVKTETEPEAWTLTMASEGGS